ncbi:MAG: hypothetical protein K8I82_28395 [Anaerolineae bacterium]|nr:hypothetical protein [Anaerolineae bacterium]
MCDEPTGNLDSTAGDMVMEALRDVQKNMNTTVMVVTHDMEVALQADRVVLLVDGHIAGDIDPHSSTQLAVLKMLKEKRQLATVEK